MKNPEVQHLYKYRYYNINNLTALINKYIWESKRKDFNDPYDTRFKFDRNFTKEDYAEFYLNGAIDVYRIPPSILGHYMTTQLDGNNNLLPSARQQLIENFKEVEKKLADDIFIYSLSEKNNELLLWAHYADAHKGFCIEFERNPENILGNIKYTHKVDYVYEFPEIQLSEFNINNNVIFNSLLKKYEKWKYEEEWRILYKKNSSHRQEFPGKINAIIFGANMPENHEETIRNIMANYDNVSFKKAKISDSKYEIEIIDI